MITKTNYLSDKLHLYYQTEDRTRTRSKLSVSDTGCVLHRQLKLWNVPTDRPYTTQELMTFDFGNQFHLFLQKILEGEDEVEVEDPFFIGHIDKVSKEDDKLAVNEFKSIKDYGLDILLLEDKPQEAHIKQATNYVRMLKDKLGKDKVADYLRVIYLAKCFDDSHRKFLYGKKNIELAEGKTIIRLVEYTVEYDPLLADQIVEEAKLVMENVKVNNPLACSEWDKVYHRDSKWNQYLSWCSASPEKNKERLEQLERLGEL